MNLLNLLSLRFLCVAFDTIFLGTIFWCFNYFTILYYSFSNQFFNFTSSTIYTSNICIFLIIRKLLAEIAPLYLITVILSKDNKMIKSILLHILITILGLLGGILNYFILGLLLGFFNAGIPKSLVLLIAVLATIMTVMAGNIYKYQVDLARKRINHKIIPIYENMIDFLVEVKNQTIKADERVKLINELDKGIWKWGSYRARVCWHKVKYNLIYQKIFDLETQTEITQLVLALRKQVGLPEESETQIRKFFLLEEALPSEVKQLEAETSKSIKEILAESRRRRRVNPSDYGLPDSTILIREDRDR